MRLFLESWSDAAWTVVPVDGAVVEHVPRAPSGITGTLKDTS